jgi:hypothetical protein
MIKRDTLMKYARDLAAQRANQRPSILAAYIVGSVARGDAPFDEAYDLDLFLIDESPGIILPAPEDVRLTPQIIAEISYRRPEFYKDTARLRDHHWMGPEIAEGLALYDPRHFFERVQAGVRGRFDRPVHIHARAQGFLDWARGELAALDPLPEAGPAAAPTGEAIHHFAHTLQFAAGALLSLDLAVGPPRRLLVRLGEAGRALGRPDLYTFFLQTISAADLTPDEVEQLIAMWGSLYGAAAEFHQGEWGEDFFVHPMRRSYYERALRALAAEGRGRDGAWLLLYTGNACANQVRQHAPEGPSFIYLEKWDQTLGRFGLGSAETFAQAVGLLRDYVRQVEEFVEQWAEREGA